MCENNEQVIVSEKELVERSVETAIKLESERVAEEKRRWDLEHELDSIRVKGSTLDKVEQGISMSINALTGIAFTGLLTSIAYSVCKSAGSTSSEGRICR